MTARTVYAIEAHSFDIGATDKEQTLKPLEEAAEVFGAWQELDECYFRPALPDLRERLIDEVADCITACANLYARMGLDQSEVDAAMARCLERNRERGRL